MEDQEILRYKDIVLRGSDLDVLEGPCFLNDQIIGFYFTYLSSLCNQNDVLFVPPSVSFWLANCDVDSRHDAVEPLNFPRKHVIVFTVNDSDGGESGTHWSILIYDRSMNSFIHLDTMEGMNHDHAFKLYDSVKDFVGKAPVSMSSTLQSSSQKRKNKKKDVAKFAAKSGCAAAELSFKDCKASQQTNGYDCGIYVMAIAKTICECYFSRKSSQDVDWLSSVQKHIDASVEATFRNEV
uniref:Ubiquitin-like protease family profile domain-containing protein n=1 Tax=Opuntia streptacantha TaxID=393608 RepID=A0A7C8ZT48_OPUST